MRGILFICLFYMTAAFENVASGSKPVQKVEKEQAADSIATSDKEEDEILNRDETGVLLYVLEHSILPGEWTQRGTVEIMYSAQKQAGVVKFGPTTLSASDLANLEKSVAKGGYYSVRMFSSGSLMPLLASIKACQLVASGYRELFVFHSDVNGHVVGLDYRTSSTDCAPPIALPSARQPILSKGRTSFGRNGEKPKHLDKLQPPPGTMAKDEDKETQANQGFLRKYWMYILPIVVFMVISNFSGGDKK